MFESAPQPSISAVNALLDKNAAGPRLKIFEIKIIGFESPTHLADTNLLGRDGLNVLQI